jgi:hypothetical protein
MGELFKGQFGRKSIKIETAKKTPKESTENGSQTLTADFNVPENLDQAFANAMKAEMKGDPRAFGVKFLGDNYQKITEIRKFLSSLSGAFGSTEVLANAAQTWEGLNLSELVQIAINPNSNEMNWQKNPGYYLALIREIRNRLILLYKTYK